MTAAVDELAGSLGLEPNDGSLEPGAARAPSALGRPVVGAELKADPFTFERGLGEARWPSRELDEEVG